MTTDHDILHEEAARDVAADLRLCDQATAGPWYWNLNLKSRHLHLEAAVAGLETVMDFVRWGMAGAVARFRTELQPGCGIMTPAHQMAEVIPGREHHAAWCQTVRHPDADLIAAARTGWPAALRALVAVWHALGREGVPPSLGAVAEAAREMTVARRRNWCALGCNVEDLELIQTVVGSGTRCRACGRVFPE